MPEMNFSSFLPEFEGGYDSSAKEKVWRAQSAEFREFWVTRVMGTDSDPISDEDCDKVIKILDSNGKGNNKHTEAIARAMVSQGAWRRLFNELHKNKKLGSAVNKILTEQDPKLKAQYIDDLYGMEEAQKIYLTGKSGNTISAFIAAFDPFVDLSIISLKDRKLLLEYLNSPYVKEIDAETIGSKIVHSNVALTEAIKASGVIGDARKISNYCYYAPVRELWRGEFSSPQEPSGNNEAKEFVVTVATDDMCTFISYDDVKHIAELEHLSYTKDGILENFEVSAERSDD